MPDDPAVTCRAVRRRLYDYLDGEIDRDAAEAIRIHLETCPACARLAAFEAEVLDGLRGRLRRRGAPPTLVTRVESILRSAG